MQFSTEEILQLLLCRVGEWEMEAHIIEHSNYNGHFHFSQEFLQKGICLNISIHFQ